VDVSKVWFITGASKGFGREWAEAALERGDRVAATARRPQTLAALVDAYGDAVLTLQLDVTDRARDFAAVAEAAEHFGALDVVVNNAGYGHFGMIEELTEAEIRAQLETNFFGALWVTQAALPIMREQGSGHILQVSSIGGVSAFPANRCLPRLEMGARGVLAVARSGGRELRHPRHADRAGRVLDRLAGTVGHQQRAQPRLRGDLGRPPAAGRTSGRSDRHPRGDPQGGRRGGATVARLLRPRTA
jgi:short chain dehydrogenase